MSVVNQYYTEHPSMSEQKKWSRWAWYAARHTNSLGEVNYNSAELMDIALKKQTDNSVEQRSNSGVWSFVGPTSTVWAVNRGSRGLGRVDRLAFHPTNPDILYAASPAGGLWKSVDAGLNWFSISSNLPNCGISGLVISEDDPSGNKIFILTGDADSGPSGFVGTYGFLRPSIGVLVTYDGGYTWSKCGNSQTIFLNRRCYKLVQVRGLPWRFLAATDGGLFASNDYCNTWTQVGFTDVYYDLEQHPTETGTIYAAISDDVLKSIDWGANFTSDADFAPGTFNATRTALAVSPASPDNVYFLQCGSGTNRLYRSTDAGDDYSSLNSLDLVTGQYSYNCALSVSPFTTLNVAVGGVPLSNSGDGGFTFPTISVGLINGPPPANYAHPDVHDLAYHPISGILFAATDGGIYMSTDNGITWNDRSNGFNCTQYYHMDGFDGTANLLIGGAQDNGTAFTTNGATMNYCGAGDGFSVEFVSGDNNITYHVENTRQFRYTRSTNTLNEISHTTDQTFYSNLISHPTNNQIVYLGTANNVWRSDNQGGTWNNVSSNGTSNGGSGHTGGFAVTAASPDRLFAANATTVWRYDNQGNNVATISGNPGWPGAFGVITDLACRSNNSDELWVTMTGNNGTNKVFYSPDAGANWVNFTGTLPNVPVYCVAYDDNGDAYIGTEIGVYVMDFEMNDWVPFYNGLPLVPVTDLFVNETFGTIQAATFGRGIWQSDLFSPCGAFLLLSGTTEGRQFYQSGGFIETSQLMPGSYGNELRLRSPTRIIFEDGFIAGRSSYLRALIGPCGQGVFNVSENPEEEAQVKAEAPQVAPHGD